MSNKIILTYEEKEIRRIRKNEKARERRKNRTEEEINKEKIKNHENYINNKEKFIAKSREYYYSNPKKVREQKKKYTEKNKVHLKSYHKEYVSRNREHINENIRKYQASLRSKLFNILGNKCAICGITEVKLLTIDHIKGGGSKEKKREGGRYVTRHLHKLGWPEDYIKDNYQILCWNHNASKGRRKYLDMKVKDLNSEQRRSLKLWKKALEFFGPCKVCGEKNLRFITIDHIHNDGAERRKNGEKGGIPLLKNFDKQGWPDALKEIYQILCYNCNCAK